MMKEMKMYSCIQQLKVQGFKKGKVAKMIGISRNTVRKYWDMSPDDYLAAAERIRKSHALAKYEPVILNWLYQYPDMSSAQVHDWLMEHYEIISSERTTRRLVEVLRDSYDIKKQSNPRDYGAVDELPMGYQMQVDFGEKYMRTPNGNYVKVYFIGFVLSHSRYKWGYFKEKPFTTVDLINTLENCFECMGGKPYELVFDQDSIVSVSENYGDIIYTYEFEKFKQKEQLKIYLCKKSDPESKGKIESVVKYIKNNFLPHRLFMGIDLLNQSFESWLSRTANAKVHGTTKKVPAKVFEVEREHLRPVLFTEYYSCNDSITRKVRKDNTILYESNRYTVPLGTFNKEKEVEVKIIDNKLIIYQIFGDYIIAEHTLSSGKGQLIQNSSHKRDNTKDLNSFYLLLSKDLDGEYDDFLKSIWNQKSRYFRDQCTLINQLIKDYGKDAVKEACTYCRSHELYSATDIKDAVNYLSHKTIEKEPIVMPVVTNPKVMTVITQKRSIAEYEGIGGAAR